MTVFTFATPVNTSVVPAGEKVTIPKPWAIVTLSVTVVPGELPEQVEFTNFLVAVHTPEKSAGGMTVSVTLSFPDMGSVWGFAVPLRLSKTRIPRFKVVFALHVNTFAPVTFWKE